ncbi:MAG: DUF1622 domain-containing protein [Acidimicrobiia bacterium]
MIAASLVTDFIDVAVPLMEAVGAALIVGGGLVAVTRIVRVPFMRERPALVALQIRLGLGMSLVLGLEFLLGADILRTAVAPTWQEIGQLAAIAAIRTGLNYFLGREFTEGERQIQALAAAHLDRGVAGPPAAFRKRTRATLPAQPARKANGQPDPETGDHVVEHHPWRGALRSAIRGPRWLSEPFGPDDPADPGDPEQPG